LQRNKEKKEVAFSAASFHDTLSENLRKWNVSKHEKINICLHTDTVWVGLINIYAYKDSTRYPYGII
ncbi:hypothetical protein, partial [Parabacteroides johnsonii]